MLLIFSLIFPILSLVGNIFFYLYKKNISVKRKKIIFLNIAFSIGILALSYYRIDNSGDVTKYLLTYRNLNVENFYLDNYSEKYPLWYFIIYILKKFNLNFQVLNFICIFFIYYISFFIVLKQKIENVKYERKIILKILFYYSVALLFSTYRGTLCFSIIMLGIIYLIEKKLRGILFFIIAILIHPISCVVIIIYILSLFIKVSIYNKRIILIFSVIFGMLTKNIIILILKIIFSNNRFYMNKINTYLLGYWAKYNFSDRGEILSFFIIFILFSFVILYFILSKNIKYMNKKYINFIFLYLVFTLNFISFRTIFYRLSHDGFIFFIPLFTSYLLEKKNKKLGWILLLILYYLILDYRNILYLLGFYKSTFYFDINIFIPLNYLHNIFI